MGGKRAARSGQKGGQRRLDQMLVPRRSTRNSGLLEKQVEPKVTSTVNKDKNEIQLLEIEADSGRSITLLAGNSKKRLHVDDNEKTGIKKALKVDKEQQRELLKDFDINPTYGPCRGILRRERYERALKYKLQPPPNELIPQILKEHEKDIALQKCIWDWD